MKRLSLCLALLCLLFSSNSRSQHSLQLDAGSGKFGILQGASTWPIGVSTFTLPAPGDTLVTKTTLPNLAWVLVGNTLAGPSSSTPIYRFGSTNPYDVILIANNAEQLRLISGGPARFTANVDIDNGLNVDGATTLNGTVALGDAALDAISLNGTLTGLGANHVLGTLGTDAGVLTINGDDNTVGSYELSVNGDVRVTGVLSLPALVGNSVVITDAAGNLTTDNPTFAYNAATNTLNVDIVDIPATSATAGYISQGGGPILHTFGVNNTALGSGALNLTTTGNANTAVGRIALNANSTGFANTAVGEAALASNTTAGGNTAVGQQALRFNVSGTSNTAVGRQTMVNTSGNQNTGVGTNALVTNTSGSGNVAVGVDAGDVNTIGTNNTFIGTNSDASANNLTNATAIGAGAVAGASNTLILGNNANVGIGTSTPGTLLANTNVNITDQSGDGLNAQSISWRANAGGGYVVGLENLNLGVNPHGLLVKTSSAIANTRVLTLMAGGIDMFRVFGDQRVIATGNVTLGDAATDAHTINGAFDANDNGNIIGDNTSAHQLDIDGVVDAVLTDALASATWDLAVDGDIAASGIIKSGASITIDGVSATRAMTSDAPLNIVTTAGDIVLNAASNVISTNDNLNPAVTNTQALGTALLRWDVFADNVNANSITMNGSLSNTADNPLDNDGAGHGVASGGLNWQVNSDGYAAVFQHNTGLLPADGVHIAVSSTTGVSRALTITNGTNFNPTGGAGTRNEVFRVLDNGNTFLDGNITFEGATSTISNSAANVRVNDNLDLTGNIVPTADNTYTLGTDALRWAEVYANGGSVHIGPTGGEAGNTEMNLGYAAGSGTINVNGGAAEVDIQAGITRINTASNAATVIGNVTNGLDVHLLTQSGSNAFINALAASGSTQIGNGTSNSVAVTSGPLATGTVTINNGESNGSTHIGRPFLGAATVGSGSVHIHAGTGNAVNINTVATTNAVTNIGRTGGPAVNVLTNDFNINGVDYSWTNTQGTAGQVLTNDGVGVLSWTTLGLPAWELGGNTAPTSNIFGTLDATDVVMQAGGATQLTLVNTGGISLPASATTGVGVIFQNGALLLHTSGATSNIFVGTNAGNLTVTGGDNTAVGLTALAGISTGTWNTAMGAAALAGNSTGAGNTAIGRLALSVSNGNDNTAVGGSALEQTTTGGHNTAIGTLSMEVNSTGSFNTAVGRRALNANSTGTGNTAVGLNAGTINSIGADNTYLGQSANGSVNNLTNATAIGANAIVSASNTIQLGDGSVTNVNTVGRITSATATHTALPAASTATDVVVSNAGVLETRTIGSLGLAANTEAFVTIGNSANLSGERAITAGSGISFTDGGANGSLTIDNSGVLSAIGTANQVSVSGATGNVTFSLPQDIATTSTPTFGGLTVNSGAGTDLTINEGGFERNSAVTETISFQNTGAGEIRVGVGTTAPGTQLANTTTNITDVGGDGIGPNSLAWEAAAGGYVGAFYNSDVASVNPHGLIVKVAKNTANTRAFNVVVNGNDAFRIQGDNTTIAFGNMIIGDNVADAHIINGALSSAVGDVTVNDNLRISGLNGLKIGEGVNGTMGLATLAAGTVVVNTNKVTANSRIFLTTQNPAGAVGFVYVAARVVGTSFTITSSSATDVSDVAWVIIEP